MDTKRRRKARGRALRAAGVVTMGLAMAGCGKSHEGDPPRDVDSGIVMTSDAGMEDAGPPSCDDVFPPSTEECCTWQGGWWEDEMCIVAVPGPFVPPEIV